MLQKYAKVFSIQIIVFKNRRKAVNSLYKKSRSSFMLRSGLIITIVSAGITL